MRLSRYSVFYHRKRLLTWTFLATVFLMLVSIFKFLNELSNFSVSQAIANGRKLNNKKFNNNGLEINEDDVKHHLRSNDKQTEYIDKRGMHVVVGKYVGDSLSYLPQLTFEETNANNYWVSSQDIIF